MHTNCVIKNRRSSRWCDPQAAGDSSVETALGNCQIPDWVHTTVLEQDEKVVYILNVQKDRFYALEGVASETWMLFEAGIIPSQIFSLLSRKYNMELETFTKDALIFFNDLRREGLIKEADTR